MLPYLESRKEEIETKLGVNLQWNPNPNNKDKIILLSLSTDFNDEKKVNESLDWLVKYNIKFREVFSKIISKQKL